MSDDKKARQEKAALLASLFEDFYHADANPLLLWMIFSVYRSNDADPPDHVKEYLDRVCQNFHDLANEYRENKKSFGNISSRIAEALEMKKPGRSGRGNVFERFNSLQNYWVSFGLSMELEKGTKPYIAVEKVAESYGVSRSAVWRLLPASIKMLDAAEARPQPEAGPKIPF